MASTWLRWATFLNEREHPRSLALVRLLLGCVILWDFLEIARLGIVDALFTGQAFGGLSDAAARPHPPLWVDGFGAGVNSGRALHGVLVLAAGCFTIGLFTRTSAAVLLLTWAQFAEILPAADRGIDTLCRDALLIFAFAGSGTWGAADAWLSTGKVFGNGTSIPAWPRRLLVLQLVAMYFLAGIQKSGVHWYPPGHFAALYYILLDPAIARFDFSFVERSPWFQLTQLGSITTIVFQDTYPIVLLIRWLRDRPSESRLRSLALRYGWVEWLWIGTGALFHVLLALTCELGIFPWAMLACYPAWFYPGPGEPEDLVRD